ncbi:MAG TPA: hypothetical protein VH859_01575 [Candidatus Limnocylindria bacterium]|jgi:hypothetical protein
MTHVQSREWRRYGFGGPPEPWPHDAQRDLDRLATSYYLDVLDLHRRLARGTIDPDLRRRAEELLGTATRHKHEIDFTLRHWATPVERARVEDRLGSLMRISRQLRAVVEPDGDQPRPRRRNRPAPAPAPEAA